MIQPIDISKAAESATRARARAARSSALHSADSAEADSAGDSSGDDDVLERIVPCGTAAALALATPQVRAFIEPILRHPPLSLVLTRPCSCVAPNRTRRKNQGRLTMQRVPPAVLMFLAHMHATCGVYRWQPLCKTLLTRVKQLCTHGKLLACNSWRQSKSKQRIRTRCNAKRRAN